MKNESLFAYYWKNLYTQPIIMDGGVEKNTKEINNAKI
jgi:hypothetical protein